jgi:peptide/nickel transport system substrate-binding protein
MRRTVYALIALLLAGTVVGCTGGSTTTSSRNASTIRIGFSDSPQGFDPALATLGASHQIIDLVYSGLTKLSPDANPEPDLAQSWAISASGTTYTFKLRPGVKFQDGTPLTAEDVVYTFNRLRDPKTGYSYITQLENIKAVTATAPDSVRFDLKAKMGPLLSFLAFPGNFIVPKHMAAAGASLTSHPIGTGPFEFLSYSPNQELILKANPQYYVPGEPKAKSLDIKYIASDTDRATALLGGSLDFATQINPADYARVSGTPGFKGTETVGGHWYWLMTNDKQKPLNNPLVRQAKSYAIDRTALVKTSFFGHAQPILGGPIPDWSWAYDQSTNNVPATGDVQKAKDLLRQAGYPSGISLDMTLGSAWPQLADQGPIVEQMLSRAGITVHLTTMENPRYMDQVWTKGKYQLSNMYWLSPLADPDDFMYLNYRCQSPMNPQLYCNPKLDSLLQKARYSDNQVVRKQLYTQATRLIDGEEPLIPIANATILNAFNSHLNGWTPMRTGMFDSFAEVYVK